MYQPGVWVDRISPTPLITTIAKQDHIAVTDLALNAYQRALMPKRLVMIKAGHLDPYLSDLRLRPAPRSPDSQNIREAGTSFRVGLLTSTKAKMSVVDAARLIMCLR